MADPFITDFDPLIGQAETVAPGIQRVVAPNASPMTFRGTNTYILGHEDVAVIDPGPDDPAHLAAILAALRGRRVGHILVTHSHVDHSPLARYLAAETGAPVLARGPSGVGRRADMEALAESGAIGGGEGVDLAFTPDIRLADGDRVDGPGWSIEVLETPGHFGNHLCFAQGGRVFTGDHVMSWATTMISPPDGDLSDFMASLERLAARKGDRLYLPGHGAVLDKPQAMVRHQIAHRREREAQIRAALASGPATARALTRRIYTDIPAVLLGAAERNVLAHLIDLWRKNIIQPDGDLAVGALFHLC